MLIKHNKCTLKISIKLRFDCMIIALRKLVAQGVTLAITALMSNVIIN